MAVSSSGSLRNICPLPPFASYPLIQKKTLVMPVPEKDVYAIRTFTFAYPHHISLSFSPRQYLKLVRPGPFKPRSYTPTSHHSRKGSFDLTIKIYPGGTSEWIDQCSIGKQIIMIGPLPLPVKPIIYNPSPKIIIIALGVGITKGYITTLSELSNQRNVTLIYALRYKEEAIFLDKFTHLKAKHPTSFNLKMVASRESVSGWQHGRVNDQLLNECVAGVSSHDVRFLVVGTKPMIKSLWNVLNALGYNHKENALTRKGFQI